MLNQIFPFELLAKNEDEYFMIEALQEAWKAFLHQEVPVGAIVVLHGKIIGRGWNQVEKQQQACEHAEMLALQSAAKEVQNWRLSQATLYSTLEPCCMCAGAAILYRVQRIVWGAPDLRQGANGSWIDLFAQQHPIHSLLITSGIFAYECGALMRSFFKQRREEKNG